MAHCRSRGSIAAGDGLSLDMIARSCSQAMGNLRVAFSYILTLPMLGTGS